MIDKLSFETVTDLAPLSPDSTPEIWGRADLQVSDPGTAAGPRPQNDAAADPSAPGQDGTDWSFLTPGS